MPLDISKLKNITVLNGKTTAQCPACAADGDDRKGNHLVIFPDGRFGCVVFPGNKEHRWQIARLAGSSSHKPPSAPREICIKEHGW
jgi:hypothetical protein